MAERKRLTARASATPPEVDGREVNEEGRGDRKDGRDRTRPLPAGPRVPGEDETHEREADPRELGHVEPWEQRDRCERALSGDTQTIDHREQDIGGQGGHRDRKVLLPRPELVNLPLDHETDRGDHHAGEQWDEQVEHAAPSATAPWSLEPSEGRGTVEEEDEQAIQREQRGGDDRVEVRGAADAELEERIVFG